jgi:hypothetical protein
VKRVAAVLALAALAACGGRSIQEQDLAIEVSTGATAVELGRAFPVKVVRVFDRELLPRAFDAGDLAPLVLRRVRVARREDARRVEETIEADGYAFARGELTVPPVALRARPRRGGVERTARSRPIVLTVRPALDPEAPGDPEPP